MSEASVVSLPASAKVRRRQSRTRERILRESARLFVEKGFANVSVEEIISAAEIARSSFYRFFANREDVLTSIIRPVFEQGLARLEALDSRQPASIVPGILDTYLELWAASPDAVRLSTRTGGVHFELFRDLHTRFRERITALVRSVMPTGRLLNGDADYTARLIARTSVPVMEVYHHDPAFRELFHRSMQGFLLTSPGRKALEQEARQP